MKKLVRFMERHGFDDFKVIDGELIFFAAGEGNGIDEYKSKKIQREWRELEEAIVMSADQYRSSK
jgi:uncharacterized protein (DUF934 family)